MHIKVLLVLAIHTFFATFEAPPFPLHIYMKWTYSSETTCAIYCDTICKLTVDRAILRRKNNYFA